MYPCIPAIPRYGYVVYCGVKTHYHTRTRSTRFGNTTGISVPMPNPSHTTPVPLYTIPVAGYTHNRTVKWTVSFKTHGIRDTHGFVLY